MSGPVEAARGTRRGESPLQIAVYEDGMRLVIERQDGESFMSTALSADEADRIADALRMAAGILRRIGEAKS